MSLNLLGGKAKGFKLSVPNGHTIRPMAAPLKRKLFDAYQNLEGVSFVDLCGGSGSVGLESWSRNADQVFFSEISSRVYIHLRSNIKRLKDKFPEIDNIQSTNQSALNYLKNFKDNYLTWSEEQRENTIFFFAPPYPDHKTYEDLLLHLENEKWFQGQLWVESDRQKGPDEKQIESWSHQSVKKYQQGTTFVLIINY